MKFSDDVSQLIQLALTEDVGSGDVTSLATIPDNLIGEAYLLARQDLLFCSHEFIEYLCECSGYNLKYSPSINSSSMYAKQEEIGSLSGRVRDLLTLERTLLNFTQRLSAIASRTRELVDKLGSKIELRDTRKTTPGWRTLEKYAVKFGGGTNHRCGLYDAFLIKNNHIDASNGELAKTIRQCREYNSSIPLEVEVRSMSELKSALSEGPDWILLDNMDVEQLAEAIKYVRQSSKSTTKLEASGGYTPENVFSLSNLDLDAVSMGYLTHSVPAVDISFRYRR